MTSILVDPYSAGVLEIAPIHRPSLFEFSYLAVYVRNNLSPKTFDIFVASVKRMLLYHIGPGLFVQFLLKIILFNLLDL